MTDKIYPWDPNIRGRVITDLSMLIASSIDITSDLIGIRVNTNIGQPSFIDDDLPVIRLHLGDETIDSYLSSDPYQDIRSAQLHISTIIDQIVNDPIEDPDIPRAQTFIEEVTERINTLVENYSYPDELIDIVLTSRDVSVQPDSTPRVVTGTLTYQTRYHIDLDHPYYRLPYELPNVPSHSFM